MSNVVMLRPQPVQDANDRLAQLISGFATQRRLPDDVFWLKENAEFLGILAATGTRVNAKALDPLRDFYGEIAERMRFFPQYYRFLLSICLDLEDLGMAGDTGAALVRQVQTQGLADAELSDLQRAEARRLAARRGVHLADAGLDARLHSFINRSETFAVPNKKAAYELTHIVFYLSEYGCKDPQISGQARVSLTYAGLLAYLDQNADLLAEVCAAMRFAGATPPQVWEDLVAAAHRATHLESTQGRDLNDGYHEYLVSGWMLSVAGRPAFEAYVPEGPVAFAKRGVTPVGALRTLSECMFGMGTARSGDWAKMRAHVAPMLGQAGHDILAAAEASTDVFEPFFERFARAGKVSGTV